MSTDTDLMQWKKIDSFTPFFKKIASKNDDYELGLAYSVRLSGEESFLLSYNPRRRTRGFRNKIIDVLAAFDLPVEGVMEADGFLAPDECSWVLGLEQGSTKELRATVYIEEVADFLSPMRFDGLIEQLSGRFSLASIEIPKTGKPYIVALDIHPDGLRHLKVYTYVDQAGALTSHKVLPDLFLDDTAPRLIQSRSGCSGEKVYRCYPYLETDTPEAWAHWRQCAEQYGFDATPFEPMPITSIGARYIGKQLHSFSLYGCVVRPKG